MQPQQDTPSQSKADEVKWFTVERGEVTLLLKEKPPLTIYTWTWMTDDREQFEMVHMVLLTTVRMILQPHRAKCCWRCLIWKVKLGIHLITRKTIQQTNDAKMNNKVGPPKCTFMSGLVHSSFLFQ